MPGDSEDSIQLTAEVEGLRLIPASLICRRLGSFGYGWLRGRRCPKTAELTLNLMIHFDDQLLVVVESSQRLSEREQVLWAIVTLKRFRTRGEISEGRLWPDGMNFPNER